MSPEAEELYSLLVPLSEDRLIVPRACVAEVVRYSAPKQEAGAHHWMMGEVNWNGRPLPVVSFEGTLGNEVPVATGRTRIVVFYASAGHLTTGFFGVLTQGFPQLIEQHAERIEVVPKRRSRFQRHPGWRLPVDSGQQLPQLFPCIPLIVHSVSGSLMTLSSPWIGSR